MSPDSYMISEHFFELSTDLLATASPCDGTWYSVNPAFERILGWGRTDLVGQPFFALVHPEDLPRSQAVMADLDWGNPLVDFEHRVRCKDGSYRSIAWRTAVREENGLIYCIGRDVTGDHLRLVVEELQYRVRNMLTVVRSMFASTAAASENLDDLIDHFAGRLDALARTQVILTNSAARTVDLENLIRDELLSVGIHEGPALRIDGPDVVLNAKLGETLGLAFHELTTNALKYGALKVSGGRLDISWKLDKDRGDPPKLHLCWAEEGVPVISVNPVRQGFGRELIEEALPFQLGAETKLEFRSGGLRWSISLPLNGEMNGHI